MSQSAITPRVPRRAALSVSSAICLGLSLTTAASPSVASPRPATPHTVDTCADDDSPGSLRAIIASPNTSDGDTIDLTQLPMGCSIITLDGTTHVPAHISIHQASLTLIGPGSGGLTIRSNFQSSIFRHTGNQTLDIEGMTISEGKYLSNNPAMGGCIYSKGSVTLKNARVDNCSAIGAGSADAWGGGVFVKHDLTLDHSVISDSYADGQGAGARAHGGGAYVQGDLKTSYSTISGNKAIGHLFGSGGGAYVLGHSQIESSTISANHAEIDAGLVVASAAIVDSTISGNEATSIGGGVYASGDLTLTSSTVAFNRDHGSPYSYGGIAAGGASFVVTSSILADNAGFDIWAQPATIVSGSNNLIVSSHGVPLLPLTVNACPKLDMLADNGGPTLTHALSPTSPAIDAGDQGTLIFDQTGHTRTEGIAADIGAFEWRNTPTESIFTSRFDGFCDN
jgi:predicted outer membrane repeat protein/adhesin HecA-like repeat protein